MRDRFSNLAAVCCEETIAKFKELRMFMFSVEMFRQKAANLFSSWAVARWRLGISRRWRSGSVELIG